MTVLGGILAVAVGARSRGGAGARHPRVRVAAGQLRPQRPRRCSSSPGLRGAGQSFTS